MVVHVSPKSSVILGDLSPSNLSKAQVQCRQARVQAYFLDIVCFTQMLVPSMLEKIGLNILAVFQPSNRVLLRGDCHVTNSGDMI